MRIYLHAAVSCLTLPPAPPCARRHVCGCGALVRALPGRVTGVCWLAGVGLLAYLLGACADWPRAIARAIC